MATNNTKNPRFVYINSYIHTLNQSSRFFIYMSCSNPCCVLRQRIRRSAAIDWLCIGVSSCTWRLDREHGNKSSGAQHCCHIQGGNIRLFLKRGDVLIYSFGNELYGFCFRCSFSSVATVFAIPQLHFMVMGDTV